MRAFAIVILLSITLAGCTRKEETVDRSMETALDSLFNTTPDFWGVVLVADKGIPIYERAFGVSDVNTGDSVTMSSIFELASVSKQFTSMAIMMLKQDGQLAIDDPVEKYIPGLPYKGITIRHLLNHTSGLPDYQDVMDQHWDKSKVAGNADNIEYLIRYAPPILFAPGSKYTYSNTGYMLLGSIVEKASGQNFIAFCKSRIFVPLQMTSTSIRTRDEKVQLDDMAWGHQYVPEKTLYVRADSFPDNNYAIWLGNRVGPGRVSSTTGDLLKWDRALYGDQLVTQATLGEAFTPATLTTDSLSMYGFGWELQTSKDLGRIVWHDGNNPGYKTQIVRMIEQDKTVIMLCNNEHEKFKELLGGILELLKEPKP